MKNIKKIRTSRKKHFSSHFLFVVFLYSTVWTQNVGLPYYPDSAQVIFHFAYTLNYSEKYEQATWVAHTLTSTHIPGMVLRTNDYREDPQVKTRSASPADYSGSGFDRGHLAPAGDFKWSSTAMSESFYMSNMSPQRPGLNRGIWRSLESHVRNWATDDENIFVVTGPILTINYSIIGANGVAVPNFYYKVILDYTEPEIKGIGFILPNEKSNQSLQSYAVTIDEVEQRSGIDFYHSLSDSIEEIVESNIDINKWSFRNTTIYSDKSTYKSKSEQLKGQQKININTALEGELMKLPGIGPKKAKKIITYRNIHGAFISIEDLEKVKGIGIKTVEKIGPYADVR